MSTVFPLASVVIPTHNRRASVCRALEALARQTCAPDRFEVIVAANACSDGTLDSIRGLTLPYRLRALDLPAPGAAAARNGGAQSARGTLIIFLDDDIDVAPEFVAAHLDAHGLDERSPSGARPLRVAVGYLPAVLQPEADLFAIALRGWWEGMFDRMREPGHRFGYRDLLSGNCSLPRADFLRLGGFAETYRCHEDYELGYRLVRAGATFVFAELARGIHADLTRLPRACWRKREEGVADVQLAIQHPELRAALLLARRTSPKQRVMRWLAFRAPGLGDGLVDALGRSLGPLEALGARASWLRVLYAIFGYWYERGVAEAAGTPAALRTLMPPSRAAGEPDDMDLDVTDIEAAEQRLDESRPTSVTLCVGTRAFGRIPSEPGTEPLAGRHLRPALNRIWHRAYVQALIEQDLFPLLVQGNLSVTGRITSDGDPIGLLPQTAPPHPGR